MINEIKSFEEREKELLELGKQNDNKVTYEQIAEALKGIEPDSDSLDELYNLFVQNGIEIVSDNAEDDEESSFREVPCIYGQFRYECHCFSDKE